MSNLSDDLWTRMYDVAEKTIRLYAQGLLAVEALTQQMLHEWEQRRVGADQPSHALLVRIAQRICSRELCSAWRSSDLEVRNCAFSNLRRFLERSLQHTRYAALLQRYANALEDVLHQTLEILHLELVRNASAGPDDPAAFLKWTQTILIRQAHVFLQKCQRDALLSLDEQSELFAEQFVDKSNTDPLEYVLLREVQHTLGNAIVSMRNLRYRQVLIYTYIIGIDERELARRLQVQVQDIYLWRHRALKALRSKPEVMKALRSLLE